MSREQLEINGAPGDEHLDRALREIVRSVKSVNYGSVEIVIQNSRIVQIERKEKFRFGKE
jgi:hypothetical protein